MTSTDQHTQALQDQPSRPVKDWGPYFSGEPRLRLKGALKERLVKAFQVAQVKGQITQQEFLLKILEKGLDGRP